jgi:hypothetical protein
MAVGTGSHRSGPIRAIAIVVVALFLVPSAMFAAATLGAGLFSRPACGCAATPTPRDPYWTPSPPPPVSPDAAARAASRFVGMQLSADTEWATVSDRPISQPHDGGVYGFVDGISGVVLEVVVTDQLPQSASTASAVSLDQARTTAQAFLTRGGVSPAGLIAGAEFAHGPAVTFFRVTWTAPGSSLPAIEVLVNDTSGAVFAYRDRRSGIALGLPIIGVGAASDLAGSSTFASGETPDSSDRQDHSMSVVLGSGGPMWSWYVVFPDGVLIVDAATGEVSVAKWSSLR